MSNGFNSKDPYNTSTDGITGTGGPTLPTSSFEKPLSIMDRVEKWYFEPLLKMKGDDCFICMASCFPLYERYLRSKKYITGDFTLNHPVFKQIKIELEIEPEPGYYFWNSWRNGLLHRGMPKSTSDYDYNLDTRVQNIFELRAPKSLWINPWNFRNRIIEIVRKERSMWKESEFELLKEYHAT